MVTGARRGEVCGLRWRYVDLERGVITIRRAIAEVRGETEEKDTKTHQRRHVTVDPGTIEALIDHRRRWEERCAALEVELSPEAFVFSASPTGEDHLTPSSVTQRYSKMADRLGIDTHLHNLRHYSATELIAGGVDVRTVAGRLGHGGGGTTTLRVYAAWVAEADQRASQDWPTVCPSARRRRRSTTSSARRRTRGTRSSTLRWPYAMGSPPASGRRAPSSRQGSSSASTSASRLRLLSEP